MFPPAGGTRGVGGDAKLCRVLSTYAAPRMLCSHRGPMDGEEGAVLGASSRMRAIPQQGRRGLWGAPHLPGLTQAPTLCRSLIYTQGFGAGGDAEEDLHRCRGCLPRRLPACQQGAARLCKPSARVSQQHDRRKWEQTGRLEP